MFVNFFILSSHLNSCFKLILKVCGECRKSAEFDLKFLQEMRKQLIQVTCGNILFRQKAVFVLNKNKYIENPGEKYVIGLLYSVFQICKKLLLFIVHFMVTYIHCSLFQIYVLVLALKTIGGGQIFKPGINRNLTASVKTKCAVPFFFA